MSVVMGEIVGILDYPGRASVGVAPLVIHREDGQLSVSGAGRGTPNTLARKDFDELLSARAVRRVEPGVPVTREGIAAFWLGTGFVEKLSALDGPKIAPPEVVQRYGTDGHWWVGSPDELYGWLNCWVRQAAKVAIKRSAPELAKLLTRALPGSMDTWTAKWATCPDDEAKERELRWLLRLARGRGERGLTADELRDQLAERYRDLVRETSRSRSPDRPAEQSIIRRRLSQLGATPSPPVRSPMFEQQAAA